MAKLPTWQDLMTAPQSEIKRVYKLNDRQFEQAARRHMDGASPSERRGFYGSVFTDKGKQ
jgi:hypothetical protein